MSTRSGYNERARNYWYRQKHMYRLADMVMHISPMDQVAEKESYPFVKYYKLLRMPIRTFRILGKGQVVGLDRSFLRTANIGFIGNGMTPTNHLGIQWFLEHCWEDVQRQLPGVRMRLIGRPPGERVVRGKPVQCVQTEDAHCGWAWGTPYAGAEKENKDGLEMIKKIGERLDGYYNVGIEFVKPRANFASSRAPATLSAVAARKPAALSVQGQVQRLILEATGDENLALMYIGWLPFV
jgi:hypothetical protein